MEDSRSYPDLLLIYTIPDLTDGETHCLNSLVLPNCGYPGSPGNAVLVLSSYWAGEYVRYLCNPGYTMLGPAVRRCLPSGQWSGNVVDCKNLI